MSEHSGSPVAEKEEKYGALLAALTPLITSQRCRIANMANTSALVFETLNSWVPSGERYTNWAGFYIVDNEAEVVSLGPFQGGTARVTIKFGKGVCGTTAAAGETTVVPNVHEFPGHIACDCDSESEIVVPVFDANNTLVAIIDIDSPVLARFDDADKAGLEAIAQLLGQSSDW